MLSGEGKPTTPIRQFKRHLQHSGESGDDAGKRVTVTVRLKGKSVSQVALFTPGQQLTELCFLGPRCVI